MTHRAWMFAGVGCAGFVLQLGALEFLTAALGLARLPAVAMAVEVAILHNFAWHERWTWADRAATDRGGAWRRLGRFQVSSGLVSLAGNIGITAALVAATNAPLVLANTLAVGACTLLNFVAADRLVFPAGESEHP